MTSGLRTPAIAGAALVVALAVASPAQAQDPDPNGGAIRISAATDFTQAYMFRGIRQDDRRLMVQPAVALGVVLDAGPGGLEGVALDLGTWNSRHQGVPGETSERWRWYESDAYASVGLRFTHGVVLQGTWTSYASPVDAFSPIREVSVRVAADAGPVFSRVRPHALLAVEVGAGEGRGQADGGRRAGRYLELGVEPTRVWRGVAVSFPVTVGLSVGGYYESNVGTAAEPEYRDRMFGYLGTAVLGTIPITRTPTRYGRWSVRVGAEVERLGASTRAFNAGNPTKVIGRVGLGLTY